MVYQPLNNDDNDDKNFVCTPKKTFHLCNKYGDIHSHHFHKLHHLEKLLKRLRRRYVYLPIFTHYEKIFFSFSQYKKAYMTAFF